VETRRLAITITAEEQERLHKHIPWGTQSRIIRILILQIIDLVEKHGDIVLGALLSGKLTALDLLKIGGENVRLIEPEDGDIPTK
jgi:hypothetical protein